MPGKILTLEIGLSDKRSISVEPLGEYAASATPALASRDGSAIDWHKITTQMAIGHTPALTVFYETFFNVMLLEAQRCSGRDEQTCLDLVQDAMLKAIKCIKPLPSESAVAVWSRTVVKTVTWDWFRKENRRALLRNSHTSNADGRTFAVSNDEAIEPGTQEQDFVEQQARVIWLESQLQSLPTELQNMISLRYRLGWSLKQIGQRFGLKTGAVDGRIRRAVDRLKQIANDEFENE